MKRLVFLGISLFGISVIFGDLCADVTRKQNAKSVVGNATRVNPKNQKKQRVIRISDINIGTNGLDILKSIVKSIPSKDLRSLSRNMLLFSRDLEANEKDEDVREVISIMEQTTVCFDELLHQKDDLYQKLFNEKEKRENISNHVSLDSIINQLNSADLKKLESVIAECKKSEALKGTVGEWEAFSEKIKKTRTILSKMKQRLTATMLNQIEGLPELKNLSEFNSGYNQNLEKQRNKRKFEEPVNLTPKRLKSSRTDRQRSSSRSNQSGANERRSSRSERIRGVDGQHLIDFELSEEGERHPSRLEQPVESEPESSNETENEEQISENEAEGPDHNVESIDSEATGNGQSPSRPESSVETSRLEQPVESESELSNETENEEQISENRTESPDHNVESVDSEVAGNEQNLEKNIVEGSKENLRKNNDGQFDFLKTKSLNEFYEYLEENLESIDENIARDKEKNRLAKLKKDLKEFKSTRSFDQKISDVTRITKSYNRIASSYLKTKKGEKLIPVPRDAIKSLQKVIYVEVFDDLSSKLKKLQSNEALSETNVKERVKETLDKNEKSKKEFIKSENGREKRRIMMDAIESYDQLMDELFQQQIKNRKGNLVDFSKLGYSLETVISSIDV